MKLKGEAPVNHALDSRLERESVWTKKLSTVVRVDKIYQEKCSKQKIKPSNQPDKHQHYLAIRRAKKAMKAYVQAKILEHWNEVVKKLHSMGISFHCLWKNNQTLHGKTFRTASLEVCSHLY